MYVGDIANFAIQEFAYRSVLNIKYIAPEV